MSEPKPKRKPTGNPMGRPSKYTDAIADTICSRLSNGESLAQICREDEFPSQQTVYSWLFSHAEFLEKYTRAREEQADTNADQILKIADELPPSYTDEKGRTTLDMTYLAWQKQRIDARKWTAMKLKPKKYGERLAHEGVEGGAPITTSDISTTRLAEVIKNLELKTRAG
jgi:hypothetical protein